MTSEKTNETLLQVDAISLSFGGVHALVDVSFDIRKGEVRSIIGPNGAGKSSMLNVINGVYRPQQGEIIYRGEHRRNMDCYAAAKSGIARTCRIRPSLHHERIIDRDANDIVHALGFELPLCADEAGHMGGCTGAGKGTGQPKHDDFSAVRQTGQRHSLWAFCAHPQQVCVG